MRPHLLLRLGGHLPHRQGPIGVRDIAIQPSGQLQRIGPATSPVTMPLVQARGTNHTIAHPHRQRLLPPRQEDGVQTAAFLRSLACQFVRAWWQRDGSFPRVCGNRESEWQARLRSWELSLDYTIVQRTTVCLPDIHAHSLPESAIPALVDPW